MPFSLLKPWEGAAVFGLPGGSGQAPGSVSGCGWQGKGGGSGWEKPWSLGENYSDPRPFPSPAAATFIAKAGNCLLLN